MHPDLFLRIYRQQERELEERLRHRRAARERAAVQVRSGAAVGRTASARAARWLDGVSVRLQQDAPDGACCMAV